MAGNDKGGVSPANTTQRTAIPNPPNAPDLSQPMAHETALAEQERRERMDRSAARVRESDERLISRDGGFDEVRGGRERVFDNDDWERAAGPTDPEVRRQIREVFDDTLLPNLPRKNGWHRCWVSTTHNNDTPQRRVRLGYRFIRYDEVKAEGGGSDEYAVKDASNVFAGCVMWREMVAMETPEERFTAIMRELHHDQPMEQARGIYENLAAAGEEVTDRGGRVTMAPGMETLKAYTRPPRQFES